MAPKRSGKGSKAPKKTILEQALLRVGEMKAALAQGSYGRSDAAFEVATRGLISLIEERIGGATQAQRMQNPTHLAMELLKLMGDDCWHNLSSELRLHFAKVLHLALDFVVLESYEYSWVSLPESLHTAGGSKKIVELVKNFNKGDATVPLQYELDCCLENTKALLEKESAWGKLRQVLKVAVEQDAGGFFRFLRMLRQEIPKTWQASVLLIRRLTPLVQQSPRLFVYLETVFKENQHSKHYQLSYATHSALYRLITDNRKTEAKDRLSLQQAALGIAPPPKYSPEDKRSEVALGLSYFVNRPPTKSHLQRKQKDKHRYQLIHVIDQLAEYKGETTEDQWINQAACGLLLRLQGSEPVYLKQSRLWIAAALKKNNERKQQFRKELEKKPNYFKELLEGDQQSLKKEQKVYREQLLSEEPEYTPEQLQHWQAALKQRQEDLQTRYANLKAQELETQKLLQEAGDFRLAQTLSAEEKLSQVERQHKKLSPAKSPARNEELTFDWDKYEYPSSYPEDYGDRVIALTEEQRLRVDEDDLCPILKIRPMFDAVRIETENEEYHVSDEGLRALCQSKQALISHTNEKITRVRVAKHIRKKIISAINPTVANSYYDSGCVAYRATDLDRARLAFEFAIKLQPEKKQHDAMRARITTTLHQCPTPASRRGSQVPGLPRRKSVRRESKLIPNLGPSDGGVYALFTAVASAELATVQWLLQDFGLALTLKNKQNENTLAAAIAGGNSAVASWLLEQAESKAFLTERNSVKELPWHQAIKLGDLKFVEALFKRQGESARLEAKVSDTQQTACHLAVAEGRVQVLSWLIARGIDVNAQDEKGRTPLRIALEAGQRTVIEPLLNAGADPEQQDNQKLTPYQWAMNSGQEPVADFLKQTLEQLAAKRAMALRSQGGLLGGLVLQLQHRLQDVQKEVYMLMQTVAQQANTIQEQQEQIEQHTESVEELTGRIDENEESIQEEVSHREEQISKQVTALQQSSQRIYKEVKKNTGVITRLELSNKEENAGALSSLLGAVVRRQNLTANTNTSKPTKSSSSLFGLVFNKDKRNISNISISTNKRLLFLRGSTKDGEREFKNITALQYAAWALDHKSCELIITALNSIDPAEAGRQFRKMKQMPNGEQFDYESHFRLYERFLAAADAWKRKDWKRGCHLAVSYYSSNVAENEKEEVKKLKKYVIRVRSTNYNGAIDLCGSISLGFFHKEKGVIFKSLPKESKMFTLLWPEVTKQHKYIVKPAIMSAIRETVVSSGGSVSTSAIIPEAFQVVQLAELLRDSYFTLPSGEARRPRKAIRDKKYLPFWFTNPEGKVAKAGFHPQLLLQRSDRVYQGTPYGYKSKEDWIFVPWFRKRSDFDPSYLNFYYGHQFDKNTLESLVPADLFLTQLFRLLKTDLYNMRNAVANNKRKIDRLRQAAIAQTELAESQQNKFSFKI